MALGLLSSALVLARWAELVLWESTLSSAISSSAPSSGEVVGGIGGWFCVEQKHTSPAEEMYAALLVFIWLRMYILMCLCIQSMCYTIGQHRHYMYM